MNSPRLQGKIAIVTGSSSGIGKAIALRFSREVAKVIVAARRLPLCEQTVSQIRMQGGKRGRSRLMQPTSSKSSGSLQIQSAAMAVSISSSIMPVSEEGVAWPRRASRRLIR